ncbi:MAG: transposase [bacterium]|nr:transposase [bacterium]
MSRGDYERFLYLLWVCNDKKPLLNSQFHYRGLASIEKREREELVDIVCFCLMSNHYHLLLRQKTDNGISTFMQKIGTGYTMYFNEKQGRNGSLFQGTFKAKHIDQEEYLTHLTRYVHLNPAEIKEPYWKEKGIQNQKTTYEFVKKYPWSSLSDYLGEGRFGAILNPGLLSQLYETSKEYEDFVKSWLSKDLNLISNYTIEA